MMNLIAFALSLWFCDVDVVELLSLMEPMDGGVVFSWLSEWLAPEIAVLLVGKAPLLTGFLFLYAIRCCVKDQLVGCSFVSTTSVNPGWLSGRFGVRRMSRGVFEGVLMGLTVFDRFDS